MGLCGSVPEAMQVFFRTTVGLLFSFLLGYTSSFLLVRQEKFYEAMYSESAVLTQLLEEAPLLLDPSDLQVFVKMVRLYLASSTWRNASFIPSELVARALRSDRDPVEEMTRLLVGLPGPGAARLLDVISALRAARARKYSSMQRIIPTSQFGVLVLLGLLITLSPFLDGNGDSSVLAQYLYGALVEVLIFVIVYVGGGPGLGVYTTDQERATILDALMELIDKTEARAKRESQGASGEKQKAAASAR
ncbi:DYRK4 [Symbiodinium natans]|uniref:DYRK4 protein n=1 Tax=Symbiodinium natans TaxID=878477 RepID=A0A812UZA6_9DINO|nr:DYRK4 [Symbiodinium natans]